MDYPVGPCDGLNVCAPHPQIHMLNDNTQCGGVEGGPLGGDDGTRAEAP